MPANLAIWLDTEVDLLRTVLKEERFSSDLISATSTYKKGEYIFLPGENVSSLFIILEGKIKIGHYVDKAKEVITALLKKGDIFSEQAMITTDIQKNFAYVHQDTKLIALNTEVLQNWIQIRPDLSLIFLEMIGNKLHDAQNKLEAVVSKDSRTRVLEYLIEMVEKSGERVGYEWVVRNFITHHDIADLTSTSRQTVTMILNELRSTNIIQFDRKRLLVRDLDKLKALANFYR